MKVLLVDDSRTMRKIQIRTLEKLGVANIVEAEDGQVAFELFGKAQFDLVMTDWNMPNMDGLTLVKKIRELNTDTPILMITTEAERARVISAIEAGVNDYLVKPFTADVLQSKLSKVVVPA